MKTHILTSILIALFVAFSVDTQAQQRFNRADRPGFDRPMGMYMMQNQQGNHHMRLMAMLDLSDEQQTEIQKIHLNGQKEMLELRTSLQHKRAELRTLTIGDNYDEARVSQLASEIGDLNTEMITKRASHQQQIKEILTEEQRIKFDGFHMNRSGKMGMRQNCGWNR